VPEKAGDYFTTNTERMRSPTFRAQGMYVGSGSLKRDVKTVVASRLKRSDMRLSRLPAWMLCRLCALASSTRPTTSSGRANRVLLLTTHNDFIHTSEYKGLTKEWILDTI
jgi:hypothetical protein